MEEKKPIELAGIGPRELAELKEGDRIALKIERAAGFQLFAVDDVLLTATQFNELDIVFTRTEPRDYVRVADLRRKDEDGVQLEVVGVASTPVTQSVVQCRMPMQAASNAAIGMVRYIAANVSPEARAALIAELRNAIGDGV